MEDLRKGKIPLDEREMSAEKVWERYRFTPAFTGPPPVLFEQFRDRLKDHRERFKKLTVRMEEEELGLAYDRMHCFPRQTHNQRGEPVFDLSPAKLLLQEDVKQGLHEKMSPGLLQKSRPEHMMFEPRKFKERIYQEVKTQKWCRHLEAKRAKKQQEWKENREKARKKEERARRQQEQRKRPRNTSS